MDVSLNSSPAATGQTAQSTKPAGPQARVQQADTSVVSPAPNTQQETQKALSDQIETVNQKLEQMGLGLTFLVDENTQSSVVKVIDKSTDELIRQFPSEGSLKIMRNIQAYLTAVQQSGSVNKEGLTGTLFNEII